MALINDSVSDFERPTVSTCDDSDVYFILAFVFNAFEFVLSSGNVIIIICLVRFKNLRSKMNVLVGNLAISNLQVMIVLLVKMIGQLVGGPGDFCCLVRFALNVVMMSTSSGSMVLISLERYFAIVFPFKHKVYLTKRVIFIAVLLTWTFALLVGSLPLFGWNRVEDVGHNMHGRGCSIILLWSASYFYLLATICLSSIALNTILYAAVLIVAFRTRRRCERIKRNRRSRSKTRVMVVIFAMFTILWMPFILCLIKKTIKIMDSDCFRKISDNVAYIYPAVNWIIYVFGNAKLKHAFCSMLWRLRTRQVTLLKLTTTSSPSPAQNADQMSGQ